MATIIETNELDVLSKYKELIAESLGGNSVYIRTKETLQELLDNGDVKDADRAKVIADVLGSLNNSVVQSAMSTALNWSSKEKDVALKKLELAIQLDMMRTDADTKEYQKSRAKHEAIGVQANNKRLYGTTITVVDGEVTGLSTDGKLYEEVELLNKKNLNETKQGDVIDAQAKQANANTHKIIADTYTNYGNYSYTIGETGLTAVTNLTATSAQATRLSKYQGDIAKEQAKGYAYNAWSNAVTGLASMAGTALTVDVDIFGEGQIGETMITKLNSTLDKLRNVETISEYVYEGTDQILIYTRTRDLVIDANSIDSYGSWTDWAEITEAGTSFDNVYCTDEVLEGLDSADTSFTEVEFKIVKF